MSLRQKEIKFKPRIKLNNNILHTWGRKFVAPKVAQAKGVGRGRGNFFLNLGSLISRILHRTFSANLFLVVLGDCKVKRVKVCP